MSIKVKQNLYNKNSQVNEKSLCDFFCKLSITENTNNNQISQISNSSLDSIQGSTSYMPDYINVSSDNLEYKIKESTTEYKSQGTLTYSKTNYTFSIYNWSGLINYLIGKEPYDNK